MNPQTLYNPTTGMTATPKAGVTPQQTQAALTQGFQPIMPSKDISTQINTGTIGTNPINLPADKPPRTYQSPTVAPPPGTVTDANGLVGNAPQDEASAKKDVLNKTYSEYLGLSEQLGQRSEVTSQIQNEEQVAKKREMASRSYNEYLQAKQGLQAQVDALYNSGGTQEGIARQVQELNRRESPRIANLAIEAQLSQDLYEGARQTVKEKIEAIFGPMEDELDRKKEFIEMVKSDIVNDLTDSEKIQLQQSYDKDVKDSSYMRELSTQLQTSLFENGAPKTVLAEMDKITTDYADKKITFTQAQNRMIQTAGVLGTDVIGRSLKNAQIENYKRMAIDDDKASTAIATVSQVDPSSTSYIEDIMAASVGGKALTGEQTRPISKAMTVIGQLDSLTKTLAVTDTGPILGILRSNNPYDVKASLVKAQLQAIVPNLARGVYGEVGVLTDQDIANYIQTLGNLKKPEQVNKLLTAMTLKTIKSGIDDQLEVFAASGRDVSGFSGLYGRLNEKIANIEAELGVGLDQAPQKDLRSKYGY